ncbi:MAG: class I SAM-dependent methyltransferase [Sedimentibacter sp.]
MMRNKQLKSENPIRLLELNPSGTLKKIGLLENLTVCDIGAGSGIFTIPAATITNNTVYALEINDEMLSVIQVKAEKEGIHNIKPVKVENKRFDLEDNSVDMALMVTVLHEIDDQAAMSEEIKRILKDGGKLAIIEFHKRETPMGPPVAHRMGRDEVLDLLRKKGFTIWNDFDLGDNFYCLVFKRDKREQSNTIQP